MTYRAEGLIITDVPQESVHDMVPEHCRQCPTFDARMPIAYLEHQVVEGVIEPAEAASLIRSGLARCARAHNCPVPESDKIDPLTA